jgi:hypothetical protein
MVRSLLLFILAIPVVCSAQYKGSTEDGTDAELSTNQNGLPNIYRGGAHDGYAPLTTLAQNALPNIYNGDSSDGTGYLAISGQNLFPEIYLGGDDDGVSSTISFENPLASIYNGGNSDGFDSRLTSNQNSGSSIYTGGDADGTDMILVSSENALPAVYKGGNGDGYAITVVLHQNAISFLVTQFSGVWDNQDAALTWKTTIENGLDHFELERSEDAGEIFSKIASIAPYNEGNTEHKYRHTDQGAYRLPADLLLYRLKGVDKNGTVAYSDIVRLTKTAASSKGRPVFIAYPNPTAGHFTLDITNEYGTAYEYIISSVDGKVIKKGVIQQASTSFDLSNQAAGVYQLTLLKNGNPVKNFTISLTY